MIRAELQIDQPAVFEVQRLAFGSDVQANLVETLRASAAPYLSLVALQDNQVVGHIFFSPVTLTAAPTCRAAQLSPVAVKPAWQGQGIGAVLIRAGLSKCTGRGWRAVFLVGNPSYYARFGFTMAASRGLTCEGPLNPYLQVMELETQALQGVQGMVQFHPAFNEFA